MWKIKKLSPGDHIRIKRMGGLYYHHGIYIGDDTVICYSGEPFKQSEAEIVTCSLSRFIAGANGKFSGEVEVDTTPAKYTPRTVIARAKRRLGEKKYDLAYNNCESFAFWCRNGKNQSQQVINHANFAIATGAAILGGIVLGAITSDDTNEDKGTDGTGNR